MTTGLIKALAGRAIVVLLACSANACGSTEQLRAPWERPGSRGGQGPLTRAGTVQERLRPVAKKEPVVAPVETYLASQALPGRIDARAVTVRVRSNADGASFECRAGSERSFSPCAGGSSYTFANLASGQAYQLEARAKAKDGRVDTTPLSVSFVADFTFGEPLQVDGGTGDVPDDGADADGDRVAIPPRADPGATSGRKLLLGSFYAVEVPGAYMVTSYSTTKLVDHDIDFRLVRLMNRHAGSAYRSEPCNRAWEREVTGPDGSLYCNGTPTLAQLKTGYTRPMPYNHVEMLLGSETMAYERILASAFDGEADPSEARQSISSTCANATQSGYAAVPGLEDFFGAPEARESLSWCLVRTTDGEWWYVGTFSARKGTTPSAARMIVTYSANARLGLFSGQSFAARVGETMRTLLEPLAPVP